MTQNFNVRPDTNIPVVLAYNMSHYESMEPCTDHDTQSTVALVNEYLEGRYRYNKHDLPHLISMQIETQQDNNYIQLRNKQKMERNERKEQQSYDKIINVLGRKENKFQQKQMYETGTNKKEEQQRENERQRSQIEKNSYTQQIHKQRVENLIHNTLTNVKKTEKSANNNKKNEKQKYIGQPDSTIKNSTTGDVIENICYKLKNSREENNIRAVGNKMECPFCQDKIKNLLIHFTRKLDCGDKINMGHFSKEFNDYKKNLVKIRKLKWKEKNLTSVKLGNLEATKKYQQKKKDADKDAFDKENLENVKKCQQKKKDADKDAFDKENL